MTEGPKNQKQFFVLLPLNEIKPYSLKTLRAGLGSKNLLYYPACSTRKKKRIIQLISMIKIFGIFYDGRDYIFLFLTVTRHLKKRNYYG